VVWGALKAEATLGAGGAQPRFTLTVPPNGLAVVDVPLH
jgi:hypothetical protein